MYTWTVITGMYMCMLHAYMYMYVCMYVRTFVICKNLTYLSKFKCFRAGMIIVCSRGECPEEYIKLLPGVPSHCPTDTP